jgi:hypothetical protein
VTEVPERRAQLQWVPGGAASRAPEVSGQAGQRLVPLPGLKCGTQFDGSSHVDLYGYVLMTEPQPAA